MKVQWDNRGAKINIDKCVSNKQKAAVKDQRRWHMPSSHNVKNRKFTLFICNRDTISMEIRKGFVLLVWFSPPDKCKMHISLCDVAFSFSNSTNYSTRLCAAFYDVKNIISANQKKKTIDKHYILNAMKMLKQINTHIENSRVKEVKHQKKLQKMQKLSMRYSFLDFASFAFNQIESPSIRLRWVCQAAAPNVYVVAKMRSSIKLNEESLRIDASNANIAFHNFEIENESKIFRIETRKCIRNDSIFRSIRNRILWQVLFGVRF